MRSGGRYVLGVDGLPRGVGAAIVVGRTVTSTFAVRSQGGIHLPLGLRVRSAVANAEADFGAAPAEVRLVCVDDGSDGADIVDIQEWLESAHAVRLLVLDLVAPIARPGSQTDQPGASDHTDALSVARACEAALW